MECISEAFAIEITSTNPSDKPWLSKTQLAGFNEVKCYAPLRLVRKDAWLLVPGLAVPGLDPSDLGMYLAESGRSEASLSWPSPSGGPPDRWTLLGDMPPCLTPACCCCCIMALLRWA